MWKTHNAPVFFILYWKGCLRPLNTRAWLILIFIVQTHESLRFTLSSLSGIAVSHRKNRFKLIANNKSGACMQWSRFEINFELSKWMRVYLLRRSHVCIWVCVCVSVCANFSSPVRVRFESTCLCVSLCVFVYVWLSCHCWKIEDDYKKLCFRQYVEHGLLNHNSRKQMVNIYLKLIYISKTNTNCD